MAKDIRHLNQQLAKQFIDRARMQQFKGKARDTAALEFFCGAAAAVELLDTDAFGRVSTAEMLISVRGYSEVERLA